jgi:hypothetical protein
MVTSAHLTQKTTQLALLLPIFWGCFAPRVAAQSATLNPLQIADMGHQHNQTDQTEPMSGGLSEHGQHGSSEHASEMGDHGMHDHGMLEIPPGQPVPTLTLVATPDAMAGWNLELQITNFEFAPERVNQGSSTAEGHAHLYVNGKKLARLYGPWYHLEALPPGRHEITASLNSNNHETLVHQDEMIQDTIILEVPN